jgi:YidC/Oxa1 family membrane protein insertase
MILKDFLKYLLEFFFGLTTSYGWSIILLSLAVTVLMLPLFWIAEKLQNKERARKAKMQCALDEIKNLKNKQEKYYYTREIYRKNKYSPLYSLTGLLGLVIQIPFFLAAYWLLLEYTPLSGVSFGPIKDLFQPDGLISFEDFSINALPFVMTLVNLLAGYLYAKNMRKNEKIQLLMIAFVFLILLYNLSAALVLYWTMNNVFAIWKNWLLLKIKKTKIDQISSDFLKRIEKNVYLFWKKYKYISFPLMFSIFPLLSVYYENIGELYFIQIYSLLIIILATTFGLTIATNLMVKDKYKTIVIIFSFIALFFSYGHVIDFLRELNLVMIRNSIMAILYIIIFSSTCFYVLKTQKKLKMVSRVLCILSASFFLVIIVRIFAFNISIKENTNFISTAKYNQGKEINKSNEQYPDIYYIVLDGYSNSKILKEAHNFDNSSFEDFLVNKDFYIASESRANYMNTDLSLAATFNMNYINYLKDTLGSESKDIKIPRSMHSDNSVIRYLKNKDYKTVHFSSGWGSTNHNDNADYNFKYQYGLDELTTTFLKTTFLAPLINRFGKNRYRENILYNFENLPKLDSIKGPKFVFSHIVCPHPPYAFDENGRELSKSIKFANDWMEYELEYYLGQLKYMNKKIESLIKQILKKSENSVIILQSDHGSAFLAKNDWDNPSAEFIKERGKIFNAILLNNKGKESLYPNISSVNTFRIVFNSVFNDNFELLDDLTFYSTYNKPYDFTDVTEIINGFKKTEIK